MLMPGVWQYPSPPARHCVSHIPPGSRSLVALNATDTWRAPPPETFNGVHSCPGPSDCNALSPPLPSFGPIRVESAPFFEFAGQHRNSSFKRLAGPSSGTMSPKFSPFLATMKAREQSPLSFSFLFGFGGWSSFGDAVVRRPPDVLLYLSRLWFPRLTPPSSPQSWGAYVIAILPFLSRKLSSNPFPVSFQRHPHIPFSGITIFPPSRPTRFSSSSGNTL